MPGMIEAWDAMARAWNDAVSWLFSQNGAPAMTVALALAVIGGVAIYRKSKQIEQNPPSARSTILRGERRK